MNDKLGKEIREDVVSLARRLDCGFTYHTDKSLKEKLKVRHPNLVAEVDPLCWDTFGSSDRYVYDSRDHLLHVSHL